MSHRLPRPRTRERLGRALTALTLAGRSDAELVSGEDAREADAINRLDVGEPEPEVSGCPAGEMRAAAERRGLRVKEELEPEGRSCPDAVATFDQDAAEADVGRHHLHAGRLDHPMLIDRAHADTGCQGATFTIPVTFTATS